MFRPSRFLSLALGLALFAPAARADALDVQLNDHMESVVKHIKAKGYKNVGVLRFRAQKGTGSERFDVGPINGNLAERVENLLVMHASSKDDSMKPAFGVIHDAGAAAAKQKVGLWYSKPAERKKLFGVDYPLAWDVKAKVKADAFVTGKAAMSADLKKTTVTLEAFDARSGEKLAKVAEFTMDTDRNLVRDFNVPYTLTKDQKVALARSRAKARNQEEGQKVEQQTNEVVLQQAQKVQQQQQKKQKVQPTEQPGQPDGPATTQTVGGIRLKITAGGTEVTPAPGASQSGQYQMPCPAAGTPIVFMLENTTDKELGVVLKVGGLNTIGEQREPAEQCRKWLVPAGKTYKIEGYHTGEKFDSVKKFTVMSKDEATQANTQLQDAVDLIEMVVYESGGKQPDGEMAISRGANARGIRGDKEKKARSGGFQALQQTLMKDGRWSRTRGRDGEMTIGPAKEGTSGPAPQEKDFPSPVEVKNLKIRIGSGTSQPVQVDPPQK